MERNSHLHHEDALIKNNSVGIRGWLKEPERLNYLAYLYLFLHKKTMYASHSDLLQRKQNM